MEKTQPFVKVLDGRSLYYAFLAGAQRVFENQGLINKINVFPVADADTGTNLASMMRSIVDSPIPTDNIKVTASALAEAALVGARGNSGIIFAQFLYGFSNEIESEETFTVDNFAKSVSKAVTYAYEAIANPVEGTMISVIREWAEFIYKMKGLIDDFVELLTKAFQIAKDSLVATTKQLEVLAKANVVDAGAKGFVLFLEGMIDFFKNRQSIRKLSVAANEITILETDTFSHEEITFRYCCEALLSIENHPKENKESIRKSIESFGDSMVVAGSDKKLRFHIHSDDPISLFDVVGKRASITYQKVDDMVMQQDIAHARKWPIAILTDSTCDIPQDLLEKYQINIVPLSLHVGESHFLDRTTISSEKFYNLLDTSPVYPTTAQPSYKDFINKYSFLGTHYDSMIGIHISKHFSGTFSNSSRAAKAVSEQSGKRISVHSSDRVASALGLIVLRIARAIEDNMSHDEIIAQIPAWNKKCRLLVSAKTVKYLVKSGRLSYSKGMLGKLMGVNPLITMNDEGKADTFGKAFSEAGSIKKVMREVDSLLATGKAWGYAISHIRNPKIADWYAEKMESLTGQKPMFVNDCSPVLGVNGGPGTVVVSVMME
ncbi:MAG: DegV family EDD domain-containing protein [Bacteroidetes bacterium]|nr:DegV family EDD domain-containing protein [Bacteroidota bacterium]